MEYTAHPSAVIDPGAIVGDHCNIGHNVFIGPSVVFTNVINPRAFIERKLEFKATVILKGASIGANVTIGKSGSHHWPGG